MDEKKLEKLPNMGMGKLSGAVFARQFRWTLKNDHFIEYVVHSVKVDHCSQTLEIVFFDLQTDESPFAALKWLSDLKNRVIKGEDETLLLTTYDGCGVPLYGIKFSGLRLENHTMELDYDNSDTINRKATLRYDREGIGLHKTNPTIMKPINPTLFNERMSNWMKKNPKAFDETKINFLNSACYIPGRMI